MNTTDNMMAWPKEKAIDRIESCLVMLRMHGLITPAESKKVSQRIKKWEKN